MGGGDESYTGPCNGQTSQYLVFRERYPKYHYSSPAPASLSLKMQRDELGMSVDGATVLVGVLLCSPSQCGGSPTPWADSPQKRAESLDHSTGRPPGRTHQQISEKRQPTPATCATISAVLTHIHTLDTR